MGWLDTPEERRRQHVQVIAGGNIRDLDRIHERDRTRKINAIFWFLFVVGTLLGLLLLKAGLTKQSFYLFGIALLFLVVLLFRYGLHKKVRLPNRVKSGKNSWERIKYLPDWAYKKMKRKRTNIVNGDHYVYKREGKQFYRQKRR